MAAAIRSPRGVRVELPGHHRCVVYTATTDDATVIADMVRHCGCTATLFDLDPTPVSTQSGAWSR